MEGEREARGEAQRAMRVRERFLANMSHEIRTPLNGILGMLQLLQEGRLGPEARSRVGVARASADDLLGVLAGVLDLSRIESGAMTIEAVPYDPAAVGAEAAAALQGAARDKDLALRFEPAGPLPAAVVGDPARLGQVLGHLVTNAVKFTEAGSITVSMRHEASEGVAPAHGPAGGRLRVEVRDTGIGLAPEARGRLFERFEQGDASDTRARGGAGLGLAICRELTALMGGRIGVESAPGEGSTFWLEIPAPLPGREAGASPRGGEANAPRGGDRRRAPPRGDGVSAPLRGGRVQARGPGGGAHPSTDPGEGAREGGRTDLGRPNATPAPLSAAAIAARRARAEATPAPDALRVLVAEDNRVNRLVAETFLRKLGHEVRCVPDGAMAVEAVEAAFGAAEESDRIDLVLMDVQMPVLDGVAATRAIRALGGPAARVPIVALTANAMEGDGEGYLAAGMDGYLAKPIKMPALSEAIADARWAARAREAQQAPGPSGEGRAAWR